ncbi:MAG: prepilin-type N-terminal cleavage/methylation domain-containing protein [Lachnospiraceae bacterium]|nr:prepilin-type N-terminal cleavage/methylation domain-containing protein [Lachnospiraceae bacterium]
MSEIIKRFKQNAKSLNKSKKGFTLVELVCAIAVLAIVFAGVLSSVAFAQTMVYNDNSKEKASDEAQLVADEIISMARGSDTVSDARTIINNYYTTGTGASTDMQIVSTFNFTGSEPHIQIILEQCDFEYQDTDCPVAGVTASGKAVEEKGIGATIRVYYERMNGQGGYLYEEVYAFIPYQYGT